MLFAGWTLFTSLLLLEGALQVGALLARPNASAPSPPAASDSAAELTILTVGDSWVAGAEANIGEGFVDRLAERLPGALGIPVRVINRGRSGANSAHVALTVLDEAEKLDVDVILVLVGQNNSTNFARVAEVEARIKAGVGASPPESSSGFTLRTVKLVRLVIANLRGSEEYTEQIAGDAPPPPLPSIPDLAFDIEGRPVLSEPLLQTAPGEHYLQRRLDVPVPASDGPLVQTAWEVLFTAARHEVPATDALAALDAAPGNVLARYALLRAARSRGDWHAVEQQGSALDGMEPRGALTDLGAAEAALLRGDWLRSRALLTAASHRAPGFADVQDLACRFPAEASNLGVQEACEFVPWASEPAPIDVARVADGTLRPEDSAKARAAWLEQAPWDLETRVDLALWYAHTGDIARADALMGFDGPSDQPMPSPVRPEAHHWRYQVLRNAELGGPAIALAAVDAAISELDPTPDAALLGAIVSVLAEYEECDQLVPITERWYRVRGDVVGAARALGRCLPPDEVASSLAAIRSAWDDTPAISSFDALSRAGNHPLAMLERDLDLVVGEARRISANVLLLDYPNPSEDHAALSALISEYAAGRAVPKAPVRESFADRLDPEAWADHLGPNGHCNATGYDLMAQVITPSIARLPRVKDLQQ